MESNKNQGNKQQPSPRILESPNYDFLAEQALRAGHMRPQMGYNQRDHFPSHNLHLHSGPFPYPRPEPYPREMHDTIQREMEKRRIREEILMHEMARRRELEAEVRRELMMETELGIPFGLSPAVMGFDSPMTMRSPQITGLPLEERNALSIEEKIRRENKGLETMPFQRSNNADLRISKVEPALERGEEKKKIILLAKPEVNASGSKRKAETPPCIDTNEPPPDLILKKKAKEEWNCTLCQISATSEHGLNEHLKGKKHKSKEAASKANRTGKNYVIGLFPMETTQSTPIASEPLKNESEVTKKVENNGDPGQKKYDHWCEICRVGTYSRKVMNNHKRGKKHLKRLSNGKVKVEAVVNEVEEVDECAEDAISESVDETSDGAGSEHHEAGDHPKPDCGIEGKHGAGPGITKAETEAEDCGDVDLTKPQDDSTSGVVLMDNAGDDVALDISKPGDVDEALPENGTVAENAEDDVACDASKPEEVDEAASEMVRDLLKPENVDDASHENGTDADVARDISEPEAMDEQSPEDGSKLFSWAQ